MKMNHGLKFQSEVWCNMTIKQLRKTTGMSQSKFSTYFGIPTSTLQDWEHERRTPPPYIISMMERILELEKQLSEKG